MRALLVVLLATLSLSINAQTPPVARLEVSGLSISGQVHETPRFDLPSCDMLKQRLRYLLKQSEEMSASVESLEEVHRGMLIIDELLRRPWIDTSVVFALEGLNSVDQGRIQARSYAVKYSLTGRLWDTSGPDVPEGVSLSAGETKLTLGFTQTGLEHCYPNGSIQLSLQLY